MRRLSPRLVIGMLALRLCTCQLPGRRTQRSDRASRPSACRCPCATAGTASCATSSRRTSRSSIRDSGSPSRISGQVTRPISLAILLDISGSMAVGGNMDRARQAVDLALANLRYGDEAALFTFDSRLEEVVPFTTELDRVKAVNLEGTPCGMTSLYDAIAETARVGGGARQPSSRGARHHRRRRHRQQADGARGVGHRQRD